ncbi:uncharacterized protein LOC114717464 [Neltuma alba]|uniref:uncharacterized protein LOC114717464 n=1 Tax=Neltuma alba TaxID=207710 RepID=UPI0010A58EE9|nr:uncharacterized protein LOC114717464 [Prosopis alba]
MTTTLFSPNSSIISAPSCGAQCLLSQHTTLLVVPQQKIFLGTTIRNRQAFGKEESSNRIVVVGGTQGSADSSKSEETIPSWAKPDSDEPPPWAGDEANNNASQQGLAIPFHVYLLASAITAIAAIGSIFEYVNQRPVFGVLTSDSVFYAPLLGFFTFTGIPFSGYLWFKSVQAANKEAEEQDRRDGY